MPEPTRLRQLHDISSERPEDGYILVFNKESGKWEPHELPIPDLEAEFYPRDEADDTFQPKGDYSVEGHDHDERYYQQSAAEIEHTRVRGTSNNSPTLAGTAHALQAGTDNSTNLAIGNTRIQARSSGNNSILYLNPLGGEVRAGGTLTGNRVLTANDGIPSGSNSANNNSGVNITGSTWTTISSTIALGSGTFLVIASVSAQTEGPNEMMNFRLRQGTSVLTTNFLRTPSFSTTNYYTVTLQSLATNVTIGTLFEIQARRHIGTNNHSFSGGWMQVISAIHLST